MKSDTEVAIIGGGAAGVAAGRRLHDAGIDCLIVEARNRLGGRAFTETHAGYPIDLGCGWLHSADKNEWTAIAQAQGREIDQTPPPWARSSLGFRRASSTDYREAFDEFEERVSKLAHSGKDAPVAQALGAGRPLERPDRRRRHLHQRRRSGARSPRSTTRITRTPT